METDAYLPQTRVALVVEDNAVTREFLCRMLAALQWGVDVAGGADEAVAATSRRAYDAVLIGVPADADLVTATTAALRALEAGTARRPLIAVTAFPGDEHEQRCREAGLDEYVVLPATVESLGAALDRCTSGGPVSGLEGVLDEETLAGLRELGGNDEDVVVQLVAMFVEQADERLSTLETAVREEEPARVARESHNLKGSSGIVGAGRMVALCTRLESMASSGRVAGAGELVGRLREEFALVRAALAVEVTRPGAGPVGSPASPTEKGKT